MASETLAGYSQLPGSGHVTVVRPRADLTAVRITGEFLARGKSAVDHAKNGWLIQDEEGHMVAVEDSELTKRFQAPPSLWIDAISAQVNGREGVAYNESVVAPSGDEGFEAPTSSSLYFGSAYDGLTFSFSNPAIPNLSGTPATLSPRWSYFEIKYGYGNGKTVVHRYCMSILPA